MREPHGRTSRVDALAAGTAEQNVDAQVLLVDLDVDVPASGRTATVAVRCGCGRHLRASWTRWTPLSLLSYRRRGLRLRDDFLQPLTPVSLSTSLEAPPCRSVHCYIRNSSPANSAASSPPVPARIRYDAFVVRILGDEQILRSAERVAPAQRLHLRPGELAHIGSAAFASSSVCARSRTLLLGGTAR